MTQSLSDRIARVLELDAKRVAGNPKKWLEYKIRPAEISDNVYPCIGIFASGPEAADIIRELLTEVGKLREALEICENDLKSCLISSSEGCDKKQAEEETEYLREAIALSEQLVGIV